MILYHNPGVECFVNGLFVFSFLSFLHFIYRGNCGCGISFCAVSHRLRLLLLVLLVLAYNRNLKYNTSLTHNLQSVCVLTNQLCIHIVVRVFIEYISSIKHSFSWITLLWKISLHFLSLSLALCYAWFVSFLSIHMPNLSKDVNSSKSVSSPTSHSERVNAN